MGCKGDYLSAADTDLFAAFRSELSEVPALHQAIAANSFLLSADGMSYSVQQLFTHCIDLRACPRREAVAQVMVGKYYKRARTQLELGGSAADIFPHGYSQLLCCSLDPEAYQAVHLLCLCPIDVVLASLAMFSSALLTEIPDKCVLVLRNAKLQI